MMASGNFMLIVQNPTNWLVLSVSMEAIMAEKKEYRSSIRSRNMIRKAFLDLLEEKEFQKITVTDIVKRADLNRSTFYAHYPDIRGVVEEIQDEIFSENVLLIGQLNFDDFLEDPAPYFQKISLLLGDNVELFKRLGHTESLHNRLDEFRRVLVERICAYEGIPKEYRESGAFSIRLHFFIGGIMNSYQQWAEGVLDCSLEELTQEIGKLIKESNKEFLKIS